jgi:hypothetical protein
LLRFEREPNNPADPNAVKVCRLTGEQLGYVGMDLASRLADELDHGAVRVPFLASVGRAPKRDLLGGRLLVVAARSGVTADDEELTTYAQTVLAEDRT